MCRRRCDMTVPTQVRIDSGIKKKASELFSTIGLDMSTAINLFLYQCVLKGGLPFAIENPRYNESTIQAMEEAARISKDESVKGYTDMKDLEEALLK